MNTSILLTPEQVADLLQRPIRTLAQWRYRREGPPYLKVGGSIRYRTVDVERWLDAQRVAPGSEAA
jgi:hypothetical protein